MTDPLLARLETALSGRYRLERKLGEGGMASVFLAEDLKHERKVALKVLRPELAAVIGAERFLSEIKTTANLQHPHILPLFDSGEADGFLYYVMPFVDGESLRNRLDRERQLGVEESVRIARDVGDALDYAHRRGIIHRDIKPANILLHDGRPVVADFGIALAVSAAGGGRMTETGLSLGTPHYMSPEQASADRDLSARSDVYSLGCVLYEMLAGQPPHTGPSAQNVLVRILTETPTALTELRHTVPPHVASAVTRAIEKLPADRFESAREFVEALGDEGYRYEVADVAPVLRTEMRSAGPGEPRDRRALTVGITVGIVGLLLGAIGWLRPPGPGPVRRLAIVMDSGRIGVGPGTALSPDGSRVVYIGRGGALMLRNLESLETSEITGTQGANTPFFSPSGDRLAFHRDRPGGRSAEFASVSLVGGPTVQLAEGDFYVGGTWSDDGYVYFVDNPGSLLRVPQEGGTVEVVADSTSGYYFQWPEALPGGRALAVGTWNGGSGGEPGGLVLVLPESGEVRPLLDRVQGPQRPTQARFSGEYLFWRTANRTLMAAEFDPDRLEFRSEPIAVASNLADVGSEASEFDVSDEGTLLYAVSPRDVADLGESMAWVTRAGVTTPVDERLASRFGDFDHLVLSPDGRRIAAQVELDIGVYQVWIYDLDQRTFERLSMDGTVNVLPRWIDDDTVAYVSGDRFQGEDAIVAQSVDGGPEVVLFRAPRRIRDFSLSPVDRSMAVTLVDDPDGTTEIVRVEPGRPGEPTSFLRSRFEERGAEISPDGRWIAFVTDVSGRDEVYVSRWPEGTSRSAVSIAGGRAPRWHPSASELFYRIDDQMMVAELSISDRVTVVERTGLFDTLPFEPGDPVSQYDVTADGETFLMTAEGAGGDFDRRILVLNVFEELRRRGLR